MIISYVSIKFVMMTDFKGVELKLLLPPLTNDGGNDGGNEEQEHKFAVS